MRFSLEHIEAFVTAVDTGSFSAAARRLGKVQSQVSTAIAGLEDDLGVPLFDRSGKYPILTGQGEELLFRSRELLRHSDKLADHADRLAFGEQTMLRIALDELVPARISAQVLGMFGQTWPDIELEVLWGAVGDVHEIVRSGRAEVGVDMPVGDMSASELSFKQLASADFCGVVAPGHPLVSVQDITKEALRPYREGLGLSPMGQPLLNVLRLSDQVWQCEDSNLLRHLALEGEVWTALPRYMVAEDLAEGRLVELPIDFAEFGMGTSFYFIWNPGHELTPAEQWLCDALGQRLRDVCRAG